LGPFDFSKQPVALPRLAANLAPGGVVTRAEPQVIQAGKVKVGVFGVAAPSAVKGASDPQAAASAAVAELRKQGAQVVVGLAHMQKKDARKLAGDVKGIDFLVVGQNAPGEPGKVSDVPDQVGSTWLVQPANRGQVVSRLEIAVRGAGPFADAIGPARVPILEARLAEAKAELATFEKDTGADADFVRLKRGEVATMEKDLAALRDAPLRMPAKGSWFTLEQVRIKRKLACDPDTQAAKKELDKRIGQANLEESKKKGPPPKPPRGSAGFVGIEECSFCHKEAVEFWKKTVHHKAWETLVEDGKELDYDCVKCHLTGWEQPGGATLAFNESLRDVQCEVCHGPGSLHVAADGKEKKSSLVRATPEDVCIRCHNKEHSDTFDYKAYLRDVTGKGHGEAFRATLGDGPVGRELRAAALEKAGREVGAGCAK
ncbi:MAG TPA: multiheme c-type cytochrome, partial [Kofleriaceae bacterium]|nr:multiheme c-type cytochrome [Kofleriaceae bacterium]